VEYLDRPHALKTPMDIPEEAPTPMNFAPLNLCKCHEIMSGNRSMPPAKV